jgi:hypothetical protein
MAERATRLRLALFAIGALVLVPGLFLGPPDAKGAGGALRVLAGEVPYRDFWSMYAPGQFYAQALLFKLFGASWLVQGAACVLVRSASGVVFHRLLERLEVPTRPALVLWAVFVVAFWRVSPELTSYPPALLLGLIGLERTFAAHRGTGTAPLLAAGLAFGAAAWFKHDVAAYFAAATTVSLLLRGVLARRVEGGREASWSRPAVAVGRLALGCLLTAGPVIGWLAVVAGPDAWQDLAVFPAGDFRLVRSETYPGPLPPLEPLAALLDPGEGDDRLRALRDAGQALREWSLTQLPMIVFVAAAAVVALRRRALEPWRLACALTLLAGMPGFFAAAHVQQNTHLDSMAILSLALLAMAWRGRRGAARTILAVGIALYAGSFLLEAALRVGELGAEWGRSRTVDLPAARLVRVRQRYAEPYERIGRFLREHVPEGERIHAGVDRHDAVVGNDQNFYFLSDRLPATRYNELHPAVVDRADVQREMIADLERHEVTCVVIWYFRFGDPDVRIARRRERLPEVGADLLDRYLADEFEEIARIGQYGILWRRGVPAPEAP